MKKRISVFLILILLVGLFTMPAYADDAGSAPEVYKNPSDETVDLGGECCFIAKAENYTWASWQFIKDGEQIAYDEVGDRFPGLEIEYGNSTTLCIDEIPKELNGWSVACLFGNEGTATSLSESALITVRGVTEEVAATPEPAVEETSEPVELPEETSEPDMENESETEDSSQIESATTEAPASDETQGLNEGETIAQTDAQETESAPSTGKGGNRALHSLLIVIGILVLFAAFLVAMMKKEQAKNPKKERNSGYSKKTADKKAKYRYTDETSDTDDYNEFVAQLKDRSDEYKPHH